jgi:hypothetical protein
MWASGSVIIKLITAIKLIMAVISKKKKKKSILHRMFAFLIGKNQQNNSTGFARSLEMSGILKCHFQTSYNVGNLDKVVEMS